MASEVTQRQRADIQQFYYRLHAGVEGGEFQERYEQEDIGRIVGLVQQARQEALLEARDYALACASERKAQAFELTKTVINDPRAVWLGCKASEAERIADKLDRLAREGVK